MHIGIIGSGNMDAALGSIRARAGHRVSFAFSRSPEKFTQLAATAGRVAVADAGNTYAPGTYFAVAPDTVHGPHSIERGCQLLVFQTAEVDATDFFLAE